MRAGQKLDIAERRASVLDYVAKHPRATDRQIAAALAIPKTTVQRDLAAEITAIANKSRDAYVASIITRNELIAEANLPAALAGKTRNAEIVLAADESTAKRLGLDAPTKQHLDVDLTRYELVGISVTELRGVITPAITGGDD